MASPRLSVIVASYNAIDTIESCLAALESQDCDEPFEVIVVDSSTDGTAEVVRRRFPRVRLHAFDERKYRGHARNLGVERCEGEILAFTDSDCIPDRGWVRATLAAHRRPDPVIGGAIDRSSKTRTARTPVSTGGSETAADRHSFDFGWWFRLHARFGYEVYLLRREHADWPHRWVRKTWILEPPLTAAWHGILDLKRWFVFGGLMGSSPTRRIALLPLVLAMSAAARGTEMVGMYATMVAPARMRRFAASV